MTIQLTQKERMLLEDQKSGEELCVKKYTEYANKAQDPQLKQLFSTIATHEQQHLDTVNQMLAGQIPNINQNQQGQQAQQAQPNIAQGNTTYQGSNYNENDATMCQEMLVAEKYISGNYDTTIFECMNCEMRKVLNHIQKEEQEHGEQIFNYMHSHGMYPVQ